MTFACGSAEPVFDVALASFAAHHLTTSEEKRRFLTGVRRHLRPGATLYVVDVFRKDGVRMCIHAFCCCVGRLVS